MVSRLSWGLLGTVAGGLGIGIGCMALLLNQKQNEILNKSKVVKLAINMMKAQPAMTELLGGIDSIEVGRASLRDGWTKLGADKLQVRLPVEGDKDKGCLFAFARRKQGEPFRLFKVEMSFDKIKGKRLILLDLDEVDELDNILGGSDSISKKQNKTDYNSGSVNKTTTKESGSNDKADENKKAN